MYLNPNRDCWGGLLYFHMPYKMFRQHKEFMLKVTVLNFNILSLFWYKLKA